MDYYNGLRAFIDARDNLIKKQKDELSEKKADVYNPFMENLDGED